MLSTTPSVVTGADTPLLVCSSGAMNVSISARTVITSSENG